MVMLDNLAIGFETITVSVYTYSLGLLYFWFYKTTDLSKNQYYVIIIEPLFVVIMFLIRKSQDVLWPTVNYF